MKLHSSALEWWQPLACPNPLDNCVDGRLYPARIHTAREEDGLQRRSVEDDGRFNESTSRNPWRAAISSKNHFAVPKGAAGERIAVENDFLVLEIFVPEFHCDAPPDKKEGNLAPTTRLSKV